jgi:hypothetical protein
MFLILLMPLLVPQFDVKTPPRMTVVLRANKLDILVKQPFVSLILRI